MLAGLTNYWQAEPAPSRPWQSLAAILLVLGDRRSLAPYCRQCLHPPAREQRLVGYCFWPDVVTRPYCYLADMRSIAASPVFLPPRARVCCPSGEPAAQSGFAVASRWQRHLPFILGAPLALPVSSDLTTSECSGTETKLAQLQCSGMERRQTDESGPVSGFPYRRGRNRADPDRATGGGVSHTGHLRSP